MRCTWYWSRLPLSKHLCCAALAIPREKRPTNSLGCKLTTEAKNFIRDAQLHLEHNLIVMILLETDRPPTNGCTFNSFTEKSPWHKPATNSQSIVKSIFVFICFWCEFQPQHRAPWSCPPVSFQTASCWLQTGKFFTYIIQNLIGGVVLLKTWVSSLKPRWPLKIGHVRRKEVFQPSIFRSCVSFRECTFTTKS